MQSPRFDVSVGRDELFDSPDVPLISIRFPSARRSASLIRGWQVPTEALQFKPLDSSDLNSRGSAALFV